MSLARALTADDPARMNLRRRFVRYRASSSAPTAPPRVGVVFEREDGSRDDDDDGDVYDVVCARTGAPATTMRELASCEIASYTRTAHKARDVRVMVPMDEDAQILCVGKNYLEHVGEVDSSIPGISRAKTPERPIVFPKSRACAIVDGEEIDAHGREDVDYEGELACVLGGFDAREIEDADDEDAVCARCVFGWTVANDVTARKLQKEHQQWFLGKSCDTFCPMSPWVIGADERPWSALNGSRLETRVNGELRQTADVRDMIFNVATLIKTMSRYQTLRPGDVILCGTPSGVGAGQSPEPKFLRPGDEVAISIDGVGRLTNRVR